MILEFTFNKIHGNVVKADTKEEAISFISRLAVKKKKFEFWILDPDTGKEIHYVAEFKKQ